LSKTYRAKQGRPVEYFALSRTRCVATAWSEATRGEPSLETLIALSAMTVIALSAMTEEAN
jgi:hypothetical protein